MGEIIKYNPTLKDKVFNWRYGRIGGINYGRY